MGNEIWRLSARSENHLYLNLADNAENTGYFNRHFIGQEMEPIWQPPPLGIVNKRKRLLDFVSWELAAPVISEKAKSILSPFLSPYAEILPLIEIRGSQYYAVNVTRVIDCVDIKNCEVACEVIWDDESEDDEGVIPIQRNSALGEPIFIYRYAFHVDLVEDVPIFKTPEHMGVVFVRRCFVDAVIKGNLRGAVFADPAASPFTAIMTGETGNVVPGLPE